MVPQPSRRNGSRFPENRARRDIAAVAVVSTAAMAAALYFDLFSLFAQWLAAHSARNTILNELFIVFPVLCLALVVFSYRRWREQKEFTSEILKAEESDRQQLQFLQALIDTIPAPVFYKNTDGVYLGCNKAFEAFTGRSREYITGRTVFDMAPADIAQKYYEMDRELFENPGHQLYEWKTKNAAGEIRKVLFDKATFADASGKVAGLIGVLSDITQLKESEQALREAEKKYRSLVEEFLVGVYVVADGVVVYANPVFAETFGYDRAETVGLPFVDSFIAPEDRREAERDFLLLLAGDIRMFQFSGMALRKDGCRIMIETSASSTVYEGKRAVIGSLMDITARKRLEEELLRSQKLESLGVLAGGIAHDFNNLLTAILGNINLAMMKSEDKDSLAIRLADAEKAAIKARDLAGQLLTFSKGGEPVKKTIALPPLIRDAVSFSLSGSNVECSMSFPDNLWAVNADEGQISQVINNLVINAVQAMPLGGTISIHGENITIDSEGPVRPGSFVRIHVQDSGAGIPQSIRKRIFDPYFTTKEGGSGLGLATVYSIIRRHGGTISVDSTEGKGTIFSITLPSSDNAGIAPSYGPEVPLIRDASIPRRVLVVDDEQPVLDIARELLVHFGYRVETASTGAEAIKLYKAAMDAAEPFDAVLVDLTIPGGMGGREIISNLLKIDPGVKAVVSSGYSNDPTMTKYSEHGFRASVTKPYRAKELADAVTKAIS